MTSAHDANGYQELAAEFIARRSPDIGVATVLDWRARLPVRAAVLDLGCGSGIPLSRALADAGCDLFGIDASPSMIAAFQSNVRGARAACEPAETSGFFGRRFEGVLAWGLIFLVPPDAQRTIIGRVRGALAGGASFLFTAPAQPCTWTDILTGRESVSLGRAEYTAALEGAGMQLVAEHDDAGGNHYYEARYVDHRPELE